ncbi:protein kinase [Stenotrophomonas sp.]|uniref:serine/threonine-protein kinase n=1 Tax=Stenotrophomonas sp. TaxID=69392 RepID=UPI0028AA1886|nr:protein kinase [Stenotrophomonas sp.]
METQGRAQQRHFSHYRIGAVLGEGGFGRVHAAWDEHLDRDVAIKFAVAGAHGSGDLRREAQQLAAQHHRAFVAVHALAEQRGELAIVMERVHGSTLADVLKQHGNLAQAQMIELGAEAAGALAAAHAQGWAHGDLKPSNLMLAEDGHLRILDFGAADTLDPLQTVQAVAAGNAGGTLRYLAPERLLGARASAAADIYSLGLVLFEALGGPTASTEAPWPVLHQRLYGDRKGRQLPARFDPALRELVERMTRHRAQDRPPTMQHVHDRLRHLQAACDRACTPLANGRRWHMAARIAVLMLALLISRDHALDAEAMPRAAAPGAAREDPVAAAERLLSDFDKPGVLAQASVLLESALAQRSGNAEAAAVLAIVYCLRYAGDERDEVWLDRARQAAALAEQQEPQLAVVQAARGWVEEYQGNKPEAEQHYTRARVLDPGSRYALLGLARLYANGNRSAEARTLLDEAITRHPAERWFHDTLGGLLYQQNDLQGAERALRRSILLKPDGVQAYVSLSGVLLRAERSEAALQVLQQGLRHGSNGRLYGNLGTVLFARGDYVEAATAFERAISQASGSPNDYLKWANLGDALRWLPGREAQAHTAHTRALQMANELLQRSPGSTTLASRSAVYAARTGQLPLARQRMADVLASGADSADIRFRAAVVAELAGDRSQALQHLQRAFAQGYPPNMIASEPDFLALRRDRRYHQIITEEVQ